MALTDNKINTFTKPVSTMPDSPTQSGLTATQIKAWFDSNTVTECKTSINGIVDGLVANTGAAEIGAQDIADADITVQGHIDNVSNPHAVTNTQVGLGNVINVKQATEANFNAHTANVSNPHSVTSTQVGLGNCNNTSDANKPISTAQAAALALKADKATGKSLIADTEITRLLGIATGAEVNVQSDWTEADNTADAFIKNKPTIPDELSDLGDDATHRTVTDTEKATWSGKQDAISGNVTGHYHSSDRSCDNHISGTTNKVYTATEQTKLAGIAEGATVGKLLASGSGFALDNGSVRITPGNKAVDLAHHPDGSSGASGNYSCAEGQRTSASGHYSHAEGAITVASGAYSHAEGISTQATGEPSHAEGDSTTASGIKSHAEGALTVASGECSHAEGRGTTARAYAHAEGYNTLAFGSFTHAEGYNTSSVGNSSHSEGSNTDANGNSSHAEGGNTDASGSYAHAEGEHTIAMSTQAHAEGQGTVAGQADVMTITDYDNTAKTITVDAVSSALIAATNKVVTVFRASTSYLITSYPSVTVISIADNVITLNTTLTIDSTWTYICFGFPESDDCGAHAEGGRTLATGWASHAEGGNTLAFGETAHAEGRNTTARGGWSHAEGYGTTASGEVSHAEGYDTAAGDYAHAEGYTTTAGEYSHAEGSNSNAGGTCSHAEGFTTTAGDYAHAEGASTNASGSTSHAEGNATTASGSTSHAEGDTTVAGGTRSHAEGYKTVTVGNASHAEGSDTYANGLYAHSEGSSTAAFGWAAHAEGLATIACQGTLYKITGYDADNNKITLDNVTGLSTGKKLKIRTLNSIVSSMALTKEATISLIEGTTVTIDITPNAGWLYAILGGSTKTSTHSEGYLTIASGAASHAEGLSTIAMGSNQHVGGKYNISDTTSLEIIGNGTAEASRSNARTLDTSGNEVLSGTIQPLGGYKAVDGTLGATGSFTSADGKTITVKDGLIVSIT